MSEWLAAEKIDQIVHMRRQGMSVADIAREAGVSQNMVYSHVRWITKTYDGKPLRSTSHATEEDKERIRAMWLAGHTTQYIMKRTGFSSSTINNYTKDLRAEGEHRCKPLEGSSAPDRQIPDGRDTEKPRRWVYKGKPVRTDKMPYEACRQCRWRMNKSDAAACGATCLKGLFDNVGRHNA